MDRPKYQLDLEGRRTRREKRAVRFHTDIRDRELQCKIVREVLIQRLDDAFEEVVKPALLLSLAKVVRAGRTNDSDEIQAACNSFLLTAFNNIQFALFPQEFDDEDEAEIEQRKTLIPRGGEYVERVGPKAGEAFAKKILKVSPH